MTGPVGLVDAETTSLELPGLPESVRDFSWMYAAWRAIGSPGGETS